MKIRLVYSLFASLLLLAVLSGNKNGRASTFPGHGNTGAPGDETAGGQPVRCNSCHNAASITASMSISILDSAGAAVTAYVPGKKYTARVTITPVTGNPQGYGFQMIALKDAGNTDLDGFSDQNPNNYKIVTVNSTGRTYAEHDNVSTPNVFNVTWTAPVAGTGNVTFYAAGNAVNKNNNDSGDGSAFTNVKLTESLVSATQNPDAAGIGLRTWPNPVGPALHLTASLPESGNFAVVVRDLSGRQVWESARTLAAGTNLLDIPADGWQPGIYFVTLAGEGISANVKVVKL